MEKLLIIVSKFVVNILNFRLKRNITQRKEIEGGKIVSKQTPDRCNYTRITPMLHTKGGMPMDIKIHRRCEKCNARLVLAEDLKDRIHVICPKCGSVYVFFKK